MQNDDNGALVPFKQQVLELTDMIEDSRSVEMVAMLFLI